MNRKNFEKIFVALLRKQSGSCHDDIETSQHCPDENAVVAYLEGQLPPEVRKSFERHASSCSRCQEELAGLLQFGEPLTENFHQISRSTQNSRILIGMTSILKSFQTWGFRPALAVLLITIVSGYIGYKIYLQKGPAIRPELDQLLTRSNESPSASPQSSAAIPQEAAQAPIEVHAPNSAKVPPNQTIVAPRPSLGAAAEPTDVKRVAQAARGQETVNATPAEPRAAPPELSDKEREAKTEAKIPHHDRPRDDFFATVPAPGPQKDKQTSQAMGAMQKAEELRTPPQDLPVAGRSAFSASHDNALTMKSNSPEAVKPGQSSSDEGKQTEASGGPVAFEKKAKGMLSPALARLDSNEPASLPDGFRIIAGNKTFVLRDHVWTDLSITDTDPHNRVFLSRTSSNYPTLVKPLAAYQKLLSRPEDVLVLYEGKVYWISSRSEPLDKH